MCSVRYAGSQIWWEVDRGEVLHADVVHVFKLVVVEDFEVGFGAA